MGLVARLSDHSTLGRCTGSKYNKWFNVETIAGVCVCSIRKKRNDRLGRVDSEESRSQNLVAQTTDGQERA